MSTFKGPNKPIKSRFTGGILQERFDCNIHNLFLTISVDQLKNVFDTTHEPWYAEPEFVGKYLDTAVNLYKQTGDEEIYARARAIAATIIAKQRPDGYLGTYHAGLEFEDTFSIWNQTFLIMGLLSYYEATSDETALNAAVRCGDYIASNYLSGNVPDLLHAINQGIENSCILLQMTRLYIITERPLYRQFCDYIILRWETSNLTLISRPSISHLGSLKAIEMLICYRGIISFGLATGQDHYIAAAAAYWEQLRQGQIGITGNGSIGELWTYLGKLSLNLSNDMHPNENCVGVGWMKLSLDLYNATGESKYMDAYEQTLYNHLLGAQAPDGHDFSYYQGNYGRKIHQTLPGQYSCCCYRGMNLLSLLPSCAVWKVTKGFCLNLYSETETVTDWDSTPVKIVQKTMYPRNGNIVILIKPEKDIGFKLRLRKPGWCKKARAAISSGNVVEEFGEEAGYLCMERIWEAAGTQIELEFEMLIETTSAIIDEQNSLACHYGPLLLAIDSRYKTPINKTGLVIAEIKSFKPMPIKPNVLLPLIIFEGAGMVDNQIQSVTLVDYASAGSQNNTEDKYRIWLPVLK